MKRYLASAGYIYYPDGGMKDFVGDFDTIAEAEIAARKVVEAEGDCPLMWAQVWDSETHMVVYEEHFE